MVRIVPSGPSTTVSWRDKTETGKEDDTPSIAGDVLSSPAVGPMFSHTLGPTNRNLAPLESRLAHFSAGPWRGWQKDALQSRGGAEGVKCSSSEDGGNTGGFALDGFCWITSACSGRLQTHSLSQGGDSWTTHIQESIYRNWSGCPGFLITTFHILLALWRLGIPYTSLKSRSLNFTKCSEVFKNFNLIISTTLEFISIAEHASQYSWLAASVSHYDQC